jgi:hypothetical protein
MGGRRILRITLCGRILEIKCPYTRKIIPGTVPRHYMPQLQTLMHVSKLPVCDFVQWHHTDDVYDMVEVPADSDWFSVNEVKMLKFYNMLLECKEDPERLKKYERKRSSASTSPQKRVKVAENDGFEDFNLAGYVV